MPVYGQMMAGRCSIWLLISWPKLSLCVFSKLVFLRVFFCISFRDWCLNFKIDRAGKTDIQFPWEIKEVNGTAAAWACWELFCFFFSLSISANFGYHRVSQIYQRRF